MRRELYDAVRALTRAPVHTALVVVTLALGMGAATSIYSVVNGVLLRPLPFPDQDRLLMLWQRAPGVGVAEDWFSPAQYFDLVGGVSSFDGVAIAFGTNQTLGGPGFRSST